MLIDTTTTELSILYSQELPVKISIKLSIFVPKDRFMLANSTNPNNMPLNLKLLKDELPNKEFYGIFIKSLR